MKTSEYPEMTFVIEQAFKQLEAEKLAPWTFMKAGKMKSIEDFNGRRIHYPGIVDLEGSPRQVFWDDFIEPFLEAIFIWAFDLSLAYAEKRKLHPNPVVQHARLCLSRGIYWIYARMQDIDRMLSGKEFPNQVAQHDTSRQIESMHIRLQEYHDAAVAALTSHGAALGVPSLSEVLELKPGIAGFSVDLKKLWHWAKSRFR